MTVLIVLTTNGGEKLDTSPLVRHILETFVGLFMLALGGSTLFMAIKKHRRKAHSSRHSLTMDSGDVGSTDESSCEEDGILPRQKNIQSYQSIDGCCAHHGSNIDGIVQLPLTGGTKQIDDDVRIMCDHSQEEDAQLLTRCCEFSLRKMFPCCCSNISIGNDTCTARIVAFLAGIIHGIAGPGGILAVIPAMHLHNWKLACVYLLFFCVSSTFTMGIFATLYGSFSKALSSSAEFPMACFSSFLSVLVGVVWLTLLSMGKLDQVFD